MAKDMKFEVLFEEMEQMGYRPRVSLRTKMTEEEKDTIVDALTVCTMVHSPRKWVKEAILQTVSWDTSRAYPSGLQVHGLTEQGPRLQLESIWDFLL